MAFIVWNPSISVGIDTIDKQHKKLIGLVNELADAMKDGKSKDVLSKVFGGLVEYTKEHFAFEESLFRQHGYAGKEEHIRQHAELTAQAMGLKKDFESGKAAVSMETLKFLNTWLIDHIQGTDKKYAPHLIQKGVR